MNVGLLWFDDDAKKPRERKITEAAERYWQRFAVVPTACHVCRPPDDPVTPGREAQAIQQRLDLSMSSVNGEAPRQFSLAVVPSRAIRPNYFWVGVDDGPSAT